MLRYAIYGRLAALGRPGLVTGLFLAGYAVPGMFCEFFRVDSDPQIGLGLITSGQMYSLPMLALSIILRAPGRRTGTRLPSWPPTQSDTSIVLIFQGSRKCASRAPCFSWAYEAPSWAGGFRW